MFFPKNIIDEETGEDITEDVKNVLVEMVSLQRIKARLAQIEHAKVMKAYGAKSIIRNDKGTALAERKISLSPDYYYSVYFARRQENAYLKENDLNPFDDPEFVEWETRNYPETKPISEKETRFHQHSNKAQDSSFFNPSFDINNPKYDI